MKKTWASRYGECRTAAAITGLAPNCVIARKMPSTRYETPAAGIKAATALPIRSSSRRMGVVSTGSRVPCSRSPTTEYPTIVAGIRTGITSR